MNGMPVVLKVALLAVVLVGAVYDFRSRKIPNWLSLSGIILGLGVNTLLFQAHGLRVALLGFCCSLAIYVPLYLLRGMGAGDVKLMAAVGAIVGPQNWLILFMATALVGGVIALIVILHKKRFWQTFANVAIMVPELLHFRLPSRSEPQLDVRRPDALRLPHAVSIALGSIAFVSFVA